MIDLKSEPVKIKNRQAIVNAWQYEKKIKDLDENLIKNHKNLKSVKQLKFNG